MGCCNSLLRRPSSPTPPTTTTTAPRPTPDRTLSARKNKPLVSHRWRSPTPLTRTELERMRAEFWDTRVGAGGRMEVWEAIRMAVEVLSAGDIDTAREIVRAGGVSLPSGDLVHGAYDERGIRYVVPNYCISDPTNIVESSAKTPSASALSLHSAHDLGSGDESSLIGAKKEKGKEKAAGMCKVRLRLSDRARDVVVRFEREESVGMVCGRCFEVAGLREGVDRVRLVYLGKILHENTSLHSQGWREGDVVNALISTPS